jgi:uncharacterized protein YjgD (DUF1641 family)
VAEPIPLLIPPRNPRAELRAQLDRAPEAHAEAVLAAYGLLQELHDQGVLDIAQGVVAARFRILGTLAKDANTPDAIRVLRNLLFDAQLFGLKAPPEQSLGVWSLLRRLCSKDSRRGLAAVIGFLERFGHHLRAMDV